MGAQYQSLLFYCDSHWLSREKVIARFFILRERVALFSEEENLVHVEHFRNEQSFLS
jgi:hypothetical protein